MGANRSTPEPGGRSSLTAPSQYVPVGIVASSTPESDLDGLLRSLEPVLQARLRRISDASGVETLYRVELPLTGQGGPTRFRDTWARIKAALVDAYPPGRPGSVKVIDP